MGAAANARGEAAAAAKQLAAAKVEKAAAAAAAKAEAAAAQQARKTGNKQEAPKKVIQVKRSPTISLFGGGGNTPTISLFGGGGGSDKQSSQPVPARAPPAKKQQNSLSLHP